MWLAVANYHKSVDATRYAVETFRELIWMGLGAAQADPAKSVAVAARTLAFKRAYGYAMGETGRFLHELSRRMDALAAEADANTIAEAQMLVAEQMAREREGGL